MRSGNLHLMKMSNDEASRLAPGQHLTRKFPITGERQASETLSQENWQVEIGGCVESSVTLDFAGLMSLPQTILKRDIHCVTGWSRLGACFEGVRFADLVSLVRVGEEASFVRFTAYSDRNHDTSLPLAMAMDGSWLVHRIDDKPLTPEHGFPVRLITPSQYFYKSLKWLKKIEFLEEDQLGFWERTSGYHNQGDPWAEERYDGTRFTAKGEVDAFRNSTEFSVYRDEVVLMASLRGWQPRTRDLSGIQMKACDFRDARLVGVSFRGANLTRSRFMGADLTDCDFSEADLEGADFSGACLKNVVFERNWMSATVFEELAEWGGMTVSEPMGLLESQEGNLRGLGVLSPCCA